MRSSKAGIGFRLSRRAMLRGAVSSAAASLALPVLDAMLDGNGTAYADTTPLPVRFGVFFWGNGVRLDRWTPSSTGPAFALTPELAPFAPVREHVSVVSGTQVQIRGAHHPPRAVILSGGFQDNSAHGTVKGPSIDQIVARQWDGAAPFRSLELGCSQRGHSTSTTTGRVAWSGPNDEIPAEYSPRALFERVFAGVGMAASDGSVDPATRRALLLRRSVLDAVRSDASRLARRLGTRDRERLDAHLEGIRSIERLLEGYESTTCATPVEPGDPRGELGHEPLAERNTLMTRILAAALACDRTRVFTYAFTTMQCDTVFWQVGNAAGVHNLTHDRRHEEVHRGVVFTMECFAELLGELAAIPEGDGTLLDRCCILGLTEVDEGAGHSKGDMPIVVAGRAGGTLRSGVHYRSTSAEPSTKVHLTALRAIGIPAESFGFDGFRTEGTIGALEA